jgi:ankyrin repeat protein
LHHAAESDIVVLLLNSSAVVNIRDCNQKVPLDVARDNEKLDAEKLLVEWKGATDSRYHISQTLLNSSSQDTLPNAAESPLGHGEDTSIPVGKTSLHTASAEGNVEIVLSILLDGHADVNDRNEFHQTALLMASRENKFEVAQLLIKYGADVNFPDGVGWTPLQVASQCGHSEIVRVLLDHGADVNAKKMDDWTALHLAASLDYFDIVKALLERGADVHEQNDRGQTPFQLAEMFGHQEITRLLLVYGAHGVGGG